MCTPTHLDIKFLLLHQHKHEEGIRLFLMDVWELWVKVRSLRSYADLHESFPGSRCADPVDVL